MSTSHTRGVISKYRYLWAVVTKIIAKTTESREISFSDNLIIMIFSFHTLEAYINYVGEILNPELWKVERNYFEKHPYQGCDGKIRKMFELCETNEPLRTTRPYSSVWMLKSLLDSITHSETDRGPGIINDTNEIIQLDKELFRGMVTSENARVAAEDAHKIISMIHELAKKKTDAPWPQFDPLEKNHQYSFYTTNSRQ